MKVMIIENTLQHLGRPPCCFAFSFLEPPFKFFWIRHWSVKSCYIVECFKTAKTNISNVVYDVVRI